MSLRQSPWSKVARVESGQERVLVNEADIRGIFEADDLDHEERVYLDYHVRRFTFAVNAIARMRERHEIATALDVGPHFLTRCICESFPDLQVSTLGWENHRTAPARFIHSHIQFDLNDTALGPIPADEEQFDLIVFSETIEHLYTSPATVLPALRALLRPGGRLFIQTPNAVQLGARLKLLAGRNPYELIRTNRANPGHFREYTMAELRAYADDTGFVVEEAEFCTYWSLELPILKQIGDLIPSFRRGISIVLQRT